MWEVWRKRLGVILSAVITLTLVFIPKSVKADSTYKVIEYTYGTSIPAGTNLSEIDELIYGSVQPVSASDMTLEWAVGSGSGLDTVAAAAHAAGVTCQLQVYAPWGDGHNEGYNQIFSNTALRNSLIRELDDIVTEHPLVDGFNFDWECDENESDDAAMTAFYAAVYADMNPQGKTISTTQTWRWTTLTTEAEDYLEWIGVMAYDIDAGVGPWYATAANDATFLGRWISDGFSSNKLVLGVSFAAYSGDPPSWDTSYADIVDTYDPDPSLNTVGGYVYNGYDLVTDKADLIVSGNYYGIFTYFLGYDKLDDPRSLTTNIYTAFGSSPPETLTSIAVTPNPVSDIVIGETQQFVATGTYSDNSNWTITSSVTWASSNTSVATISVGGLTTGVAVGTTLISCNKDDVYSSNVSLSVVAPTLDSVTIAPTNPGHVKVGLNQQFSATGHYSDSSSHTLTSSVTWNSSNESIATISVGGLAIGIAAGNTLISANISGIFSSNVTLTVKALTSLAVTPDPSTNLAVGSTEQFTATGHYSDNSQSTLTTSVTWSSSNTSAATISSGGLTTGVAEGLTLISCNMTGITSPDVTLTVVSPGTLLTSITVTPSIPPSIAVGEALQFVATGHYSDNSSAIITASVIWVSSDSSKATISIIGMAVGQSAGTALISAALSGTTSSNVLVSVTASTTVAGYTTGTTFAQSLYPFAMILAPILIGLKWFESGNKPFSGLFLLLIIMFLVIAFLPVIVPMLDGL
jgi:hypothetical protein